MIELKIPEDLFEGHSCLEYGVPWMTEGAIRKIVDNVYLDEQVLEVGAGGSTIFFSKRCAYVTSIETSVEWSKRVEQQIEKENTLNLNLYLIEKEDEIISQLEQMDSMPVNIFSVDPQGGYNRSKMLNAFLSQGISHNLKMIILDNYAHPELFPDHWDKNIFEGNPEWEMFTFDHERWAGNGTRIYLKKQ